MPITPFLKDKTFEPELIRVMGIAFERACERLGLTQTEDRATEMVASRVIRLAQQGVNDADTLCRRVLDEFNAGA